MPAKTAKTATKANATSATVSQSNGRRAPTGVPKATLGVTSKAAIRNIGKAKPTATAPTESSARPPRTKVEKYSYKMPKSEHDAIVALKRKWNEQGIKVKKSELIRAGIHLLVSLSDARIKASLEKISTVAARVEKAK
ncbi:hypothetical protein [Massilia sp. PWRC2]|uniref:hypothetical protein n=1 Tax=Massilia sp. PWRC2 TaxID=2804626 RepID=UPI003CFB43BD